MHKALAMTSLLSLAVGCVVQNEAGPNTGILAADLAEKHEPVIVGDVNWVETSSLPATSSQRAVSRAVGLLWLPARGTRCTGFMITPEVLMTNEHCVSSAADARDAWVVFDAEAGVSDSERDAVDCGTFIGADASLDMALLRCDGRPGDRHGVVSLSADAPSRGDSVYVVHQNCDYYRTPSCEPNKKYSPGTIVGLDTQEYSYDADTLGGSSGAALFDAQHRVIGLHHVGVGGNSSGRGSYNRAVRMNRILPVLQSRYAEIFNTPPPATNPAPAEPPAEDIDPTVDQYEPNDAAGSSTPVALPFDASSLYVASGDRDIFRFTLGQRRTVRISMGFNHAQGDLDLYLYKSGQSGAVARSEGVTNTESIAVTLSAGTYYVLAVGYNNAQGAYRLTLQ